MENSTNHEHTMLFIHGAGSSADFWHMQHEAFPHAHYVNLPGHGPSHEPPTGRSFSIEDYAGWVAGYVERVGLDSVVVNGHSMGGALALELALRQPDWLAGLVLTCTGARFSIDSTLLSLLRDDFEEGVDRIMEDSFPSGGNLTYRQRAIRYGTKRQMLRTPQQVVLADYAASARFDVTGKLHEVRVPTLIVAGELDRLTPPELSAELHRGIAGSRLVVLPNAGHMLPMEQAEEYNGLLAGLRSYV
jgi:pimeloyl-ACP methyl ester carboxylesterase